MMLKAGMSSDSKVKKKAAKLLKKNYSKLRDACYGVAGRVMEIFRDLGEEEKKEIVSGVGMIKSVYGKVVDEILSK